VTLLLSRSDISGLMGPADYLAAVETGFRAAEEGKASSPAPMALAGEGGTFHAKGASLGLERLRVALKLNGNFPDNEAGLPTIQGAILLCDGGNGALLAVMDSIEVTLRRTAAASALAARFLARPDSRSVLVCGCGMQALAQLEALAQLLPLRRCFAWDRDFERSKALARAALGLGMAAEPVADLDSVAPASDVIVTCTTAREPFLGPGQVGPGCFIAAVGADSPEKSEIHPELMGKSRIVVDRLEQCLDMGDLRHAVRAGTVRPDQVHASLGALVTGAAEGRTRDDEIFVFDSTGTALQDVAAASAIYDRACRRSGFEAFAFASDCHRDRH
jgi:ornithine cyclodeaminase/alanine dehydrogenase-like protein (mu-crystallin family)